MFETKGPTGANANALVPSIKPPLKSTGLFQKYGMRADADVIALRSNAVRIAVSLTENPSHFRIGTYIMAPP